MMGYSNILHNSFDDDDDITTSKVGATCPPIPRIESPDSMLLQLF